MKCANCGTEMETGYSLKSNTYGTVRIEKMQIKDRMDCQHFSRQLF